MTVVQCFKCDQCQWTVHLTKVEMANFISYICIYTHIYTACKKSLLTLIMLIVLFLIYKLLILLVGMYFCLYIFKWHLDKNNSIKGKNVGTNTDFNTWTLATDMILHVMALHWHWSHTVYITQISYKPKMLWKN